MRVCLFEDRSVRFEPLCWTRPVFDLRCGVTTLAEKQLRYLDASSWGALVRPELEELHRQQNPGVAVNDRHWLATDALTLVNGRWLPPDEPLGDHGGPHAPCEDTRRHAERNDGLGESCVGLVGSEVAYVVLKKNVLTSIPFEQLPMLLEVWRHTLPTRQAGGRMIAYAWDLVDANADEIRRDFGWLRPMRDPAATQGLSVVGPLGQLWLAPSARIEPMVVIDTTRGPVVIGENAVVSAFTRLEGPCCIGPGTQVLGAKIRAGTTLGPHCRVGGEVEASILHGYSNKYHDGFLGHSYVGEWVNIGAGTHNSDLRNDYGPVTMILGGEPVRTGLTKVGCFLGDHTKTGLGTLFNTGTNVGPFCGVLPTGRFAPKYLPPFTSWWNGSLREASTLDQLLATAEIAMSRRGVALTEAHADLYGWLLEETNEERRRAMRDSVRKPLAA